MRFTGGKFSCLKDEVVYRATNDGMCPSIGSVHENGTWYGKVLDFYSLDYIVSDDDRGFVYVERFDHIAIDGDIGGGYYSPVERRWAEIEAEVSAWYGDDEDDDS